MSARELELDHELGETATPGEAEIARSIASKIRLGLEAHRTQGGRPVRRDAHPKAHGCVEAELRVDEELPERFAKGMLIPGKRYRAWIRFSNGDGDATRPDWKGDSRGMAIKVLGVPGRKVLPEESSATTHDFLLIDHPTFIIDDPARYLKLIERSGSARLLERAMAPLAMNLRGLVSFIAISRSTVTSLLQTRYYSATAYRLGSGPERLAVKYSVVPRPPAPVYEKVGRSPGFLRERLIDDLERGPASFDFMVQPRASSRMSVESAVVEWDERVAPFFKVATIELPKQTFATPERDAFGENLSFTPWHALPEHRPLGGVNRVRRTVYEEISRFRHEQNGTPRVEPDDQ